MPPAARMPHDRRRPADRHVHPRRNHMTLPATPGSTIDDADLAGRVAALSLEQKVRLLTGADFWSLYPEPAAGLRRLVVSDGPAGVRGERCDERDTSANVPSPTALAATWDETRIERLGPPPAPRSRGQGGGGPP